MTNELPFRPNVCMFLLNSRGEVWLGERNDAKVYWQLPQGGVTGDGPLEESVIRELVEETGAPAERYKILKKLEAVHEYEFNDPPAAARGKWRGQRQTFWVVQFLGEDSEFKLDTHEEIEFSSWQWIPLDSLLDEVPSYKSDGYRKALPEVLEIVKDLINGRTL